MSHIPEAAVEAAAEAIYERRFGPKGWDGLPDKPRKQYADDARSILEAAAPYLMEQAWDECERAEYVITLNADEAAWEAVKANPYRTAK